MTNKEAITHLKTIREMAFGDVMIEALTKGIEALEERPTGDFTRNELESWLYRIASNNLDNELGRSCEEIICRLNGFERFVSDMRKGDAV